MAAFKSVLLRLVYSCSRYSEEYGHGPFWAARKPLFATGNLGVRTGRDPERRLRGATEWS